MNSDLFPLIEPFATGRLALGDPHVMYWEQSGRRDGRPVLILHGGPGAGSQADQRRVFDPAFWRIVMFDQRGAGKSTPHGETRGNTTAALIEDIERLRVTLGIERWVVAGGSWGSTLALAYAQAHPARCEGLILRGLWLARQSEIDWFMKGMGTFFPEAHRAFAGEIPMAERKDLLTAYGRRLADPDPAIHRAAARAWSRYEGACATLLPDAAATAMFEDDATAIGIGRIEAHYFANETWFRDHPILERIEAIRHLPAVIVQGRYDVICPIVTADEVARAWPEARYVIVPDAGHLEREPGIRAALVEAGEHFKTIARGQGAA
ncbi:MAG: prolyl aminopeptidase [Caulobacteraceae bacterium]